MRDTASRMFPTPLLFDASEKSTITSAKSTTISTTPNTLQGKKKKKKNQRHKVRSLKLIKEWKHVTQRDSPKAKGHDKRRDCFTKIAVKMRGGGTFNAMWSRGVLQPVWVTYWYVVSGNTLSSFPSSISTFASSIFAIVLTVKRVKTEKCILFLFYI